MFITCTLLGSEWLWTSPDGRCVWWCWILCTYCSEFMCNIMVHVCTCIMCVPYWKLQLPLNCEPCAKLWVAEQCWATCLHTHKQDERAAWAGNHYELEDTGVRPTTQKNWTLTMICLWSWCYQGTAMFLIHRHTISWTSSLKIRSTGHLHPRPLTSTPS